jgi:hypothetical protein
MDNPFADLIPQKAGNPFADLIPSQKSQPSITDAVTDIPGEIANAAADAWQNIKGVTKRGGQGPIEGLLTTGKAVMGIPQLALSPITGAARSLIGHPMAQAEHAVGTLIAPDIAAKDDPQKMYETAKGDVDLAMTAMRPAGAPVKVAGPSSLPAVPGSPAPPIQPGGWQWQHPSAAPAKVEAPTIQELKSAARADYSSPEVTGLEVKPTTIKNYSAAAKTILNNEGFDENVAPKTFGILGKLESIPTGATVTGQNFNSLRKMLGKAAGSVEPSEKAAASMAIEHLDSFIPSIPGSEVIAGDVAAAADKLATARGNYSAAKQSEKIDNKLVQAEVRAASANSGMNVANTIRQRMADVVLKPKEQRGLLPEEIQAAQDISEGTRTQNTLRAAGNILGGGGGLGTAVVGAIGGIATGGPGAALPIAGFALKALSNKLTVRQAEKLSEMIRSRAPLASSSVKFNQAAAQVQAARTPQAIAGVVLAARNLSTNLRSAGFNIAPADLLSGLQSPSGGNAQEQQDVPRPPGQ